MGFYTGSELKQRMNGGKVRELEVKDNVMYDIWIPELKLFYQGKHFDIKTVPGVKTKRKVIFCGNKHYNETITGMCVICDYIDKLWLKWRNTTVKAEKEKIIANINKLQCQYFYINCIDMNDPEQRFLAMRLTPAKAKDLILIDENNKIANIKWKYKRSVKATKGERDRVEYILTELVGDKDALELAENFDTLSSRAYDNGGLVDLEAGYGTNKTPKELRAELLGETLKSDDGDFVDNTGIEETNVSDSTDLDEISTTLDESDDLDSLSLETETKVDDLDSLSLETETKVDDLDSLSLDDDLDSLSLDDDKKEIKLVKLELNFLTTNKAAPNIVNPIIEYCKDKVKPSGDYVTDIKALFVYLKTNDILIPQDLLVGVPF